MLLALDDTMEEKEWRGFHATLGGTAHALNTVLRMLNDDALIGQV
jgi:hypothetical protein